MSVIRRIIRIWVQQGRLSRHKVAVGEPAAGSPPYFFYSWFTFYFHNGPLAQSGSVAPPLQGGGLGFKKKSGEKRLSNRFYEIPEGSILHSQIFTDYKSKSITRVIGWWVDINETVHTWLD